MKVSVIVPEEYMGDVIGDLNARRGQIQGMEARPARSRSTRMVPLSEMFGYATDLRSTHAGPRPVHHGAPATMSRFPRALPRRSLPSADARGLNCLRTCNTVLILQMRV